MAKVKVKLAADAYVAGEIKKAETVVELDESIAPQFGEPVKKAAAPKDDAKEE